MKIVLLCETFAKEMGYLENFLPKHLARLGHQVHLVTLGLHPSYRMRGFSNTYGAFVDGKETPPGTIATYQGFTLHVLPARKVFGYMQMVGLNEKLASIGPDVVQTTGAIGWCPLQAAMAKPFLGYTLFTENHTHASVFPLAHRASSLWSKELLRCRFMRTLPGWLVSLFTTKCYAITSDCADIAVRYFGIPPRKVAISPLGVDTEIFRPMTSHEDHSARALLRQRLGLLESDVVCIYTGRFSQDKNPLLLAKAVSRLASDGRPYCGLFVGNGPQAEMIQRIGKCTTHGFVPVNELGNFYRASDIGVWPAQESLSMLDAAACGLPIVANDSMAAPERVEGNGAVYKLNDLESLAKVLLQLQDPETRRRLGSFGADKMARNFTWESVARRRLQDYQAAFTRRGAIPSDARMSSKPN